MAGVATQESGAGSSLGGVSSEQQCQSGEALAEWRSSEQVENGITSTSPPYWDSDDDDDGGLKPSELYGTHTWKIEKFSQVTKRELRGDIFEVGGYKCSMNVDVLLQGSYIFVDAYIEFMEESPLQNIDFLIMCFRYILIYPQGCDVCNHLSLFLCVANHDKLLPGWSHFAQFTIAVVNKDPKKSKYSDTLHRFWKKEHDWGWKKFMELSKVMDGFIDADTLIIKAQVQVIRERVERPFRCLDCKYRRELVRVYLTNVEQICGRFIEERRTKLGKLIEDKARWSSFCSFWLGMDQSSRRRMSREKTESILKVVVKHFFIEKEVTSTLVMDSLYSGLKALEEQNKGKKSKGKYLEAGELPVPIVRVEKDMFILVDDVLLMLERAAVEPLPPKDEKGPQNRTEDGSAGEEFNKDSIERDERQLTELGRRTIEIFVLAQIFSKIEVSYQEAVALKKQEELIREEAAWLAESEQKAKRGADKEKKSKRKQGKQKRNNRKGKDKARDDKSINIVQDKIEQDNPAETKDFLAAEPETVLEKPDAVEDVSDVSDSVDCLPEIPIPDSEGTDTSEVHPPTEAGINEIHNGAGVKSSSVMDDSSSTCSSDSVPSVVLSVPHKGNSRYPKNLKSPIRVKNHQSKLTSETADWVNGEVSQPSKRVDSPNDASRGSKPVGSLSQAAGRPLQAKVVNGTERHVGKKDEESGSMRINSSVKNVVGVEVSENRAARVTSLPMSPSKSIPSQKLEPKTSSASEPVMFKKPSSDSTKQADSSNSAINGATVKPEPQKLATPKPAEKPFGHQLAIISDKLPTQQVPVMSRPLSAPIAPGPRPSVSMSSMVQTAPVLARSASAAGRLGPEPPTPSTTQSYIPHSYRNAIIGGPVTETSSAYSQNHSGSSGVSVSHSYSQTPSVFVSAPLFSPHSSGRIDAQPNLSFGMVNHHDMLQNGPMWMERAPERNLNSLVNDMQRLDLYNPPVFPAGTSGRQSHTMADEFPHLDIINDLLDDEHGTGRVARVNSAYQSFSNGHHLNRQFSLPSDPGLSSGSGPSMSSCRFDRSRSYQDDVYQHGYGAPGSPYNTVRDMIPRASPQPYVNGPVDGFMPNQWQMAGSDLPYVSVRNTGNGGHPYHIPEYPNLPVGANGYTVFRPSNGL
ncbi:hypothetical protein BUALT_Bualt12G0140500 [Buddleja alternifolia]|uniref:MATH domain-containing protein n=1 Tax=Buddleja alternifolia TaxID=168488 RepID=A0AAV6WW49_9LAMI|nr:hypothetical protein BUALT_Bualt12G0140500 [Buddleja alternifolia]